MVRGVIVTTQVGLSARVVVPSVSGRVVVAVSSGIVTTRGRPALSIAILELFRLYAASGESRFVWLGQQSTAVADR